MSDANSSPDQLDQLFSAPESAPSVPVVKLPSELKLDPSGIETLPSAEEARLRALQRFAMLLQSLTPVIWVTPLLLLSNIAVFVAMVAQGISPISPTSADLIQWGANYAPLTWDKEPWRLVSNMFLHCGMFHLMVNMWALWSAGRFLEKLVGNIGLIVIYLASGIAGSIASLWWNGDVASAGASGAIFGLFGALASFLWHRADSFPSGVLPAMRSSIGTCILLNLLLGAAIEGIDQAAHVGGLLGGLVCGLLLSQPLDEQSRQRRVSKNLLTAAVSTLVLGILILQHPAPPPDFFQEQTIYEEVVRPSLESFAEKVRQFEKQEISRKALASWIEDELLPPWQKVLEHFKTLSNIPAGRRDRLHQMRNVLIRREESWKVLIEALRQNSLAKRNEYQEKWKQAELLEEKLRSEK